MNEAEAQRLQALPDRVRKVVIERRWRVLPQAQDKATFVRWREFRERQPTDGELDKWALDFPNSMWAVMTGQPSGVIVFDFDVKDGGMETLRSLDLRPLMSTPSGGAHVYAYAPDYEVRGGARLDPGGLPGMDLRADGQLATFYGRKVIGGGQYEPTRQGRVYRVEQLPTELQRLLVERRKAAQHREFALPDGFDTFAASTALVEEALGLVASGGSRNSAGFHLACQLRDERYEFAQAEEVMVEFAAAVAKGGHPYTPQEAYNSLVSAYSSPAREPRAYGKFKRGDGFAHTDYGNAERLIEQHGEDLRYASFSDRWLLWDGQRWTSDETGEVERRAKATVRQMLRAAADVENDEDRQRLAKFARASEAAPKLSAMVRLARTEPGVAVAADDLDADRWKFNVLNGTLDLRTGQLHEHDRNDLITKVAPVRYDPSARCPKWEAFVRRVVPDDAEREFVQRAAGYSLTGDTGEHVAFLLYGSGANGKSTFVETLRNAAGDYAQSAPTDLLLTKRSGGVPNDVARIRGARLVTVTETDEGRQLAEALFKQLTGGDRIAARFMYNEFFEFTPVAKFWLATNHKPEVTGGGEAIWRRIHLIPFTVTIPEPERNPRLMQELRDELPGVLHWAVVGALAWKADGLQVPASIRAATDSYREEMDAFGQFIEDYCVVGEHEHALTSDLYAAYEMWAADAGVHYAMTKQKFGRVLAERDTQHIQPKKFGPDRQRGWVGIGVRPQSSRRLSVVRGG